MAESGGGRLCPQCVEKGHFRLSATSVTRPRLFDGCPPIAPVVARHRFIGLKRKGYVLQSGARIARFAEKLPHAVTERRGRSKLVAIDVGACPDPNRQEARVDVDRTECKNIGSGGMFVDQRSEGDLSPFARFLKRDAIARHSSSVGHRQVCRQVSSWGQEGVRNGSKADIRRCSVLRYCRPGGVSLVKGDWNVEGRLVFGMVGVAFATLALLIAQAL